VEEFQEPIYQLPISGIAGTRNELFGLIKKQVLTVRDIEEQFGIPSKTLYNLVNSMPRDRNPVPLIKRGSVNTFPAEAFRTWYLEQGHAQIVSLEKTPKGKVS
jgi:hypothetical protein